MGEHAIEVCIDWGTSKIVASFAVTCNGAQSGEPTLLMIDEFAYQVPAIATWVGGIFHHGLSLQQAIDKGTICSDKTLTLFKLALYPDKESTTSIEGVLEAFPQQPMLDDLLTEHIGATVHDIKNAISLSEVQLRFTKAEIADLLNSMRVRITVPQLWTPSARRRMQAAAKNAGLKTVVLASEPQCALAYLANKIAQGKTQLGKNFEKGCVILVVDLGAGTGDLVSYRLQSASFGADSRWEAVGDTSGDLCGSSKVNEFLYETLVAREDDLWQVDTARELQVSKNDLERRALLAIEKIKCDEFHKDKNTYTGFIEGLEGTYKSFQLSKKEICGVIDKILKMVFKAIDRHVKLQKPDFIYCTGGFALNAYLMEQLRKRYEKHITVVATKQTSDEDRNPIALGGLYRYDNISTSALPTKYGYAVLQDEDYDKNIHGRAGSNIVLKSPWDNKTEMVEDRIINIIPAGTVLNGTRAYKYNVTLIFHQPLNDPHVSAEFVYLTKAFDDHAAAKQKDRKTKTLVLRPGVHPWVQVRLCVPIDKLEKAGFPIRTVDNALYWKFYARPTIETSGQDMCVGFKIFKPDFKPRADGSRHNEEDVFLHLKDTVWSSNHSEFDQGS